MSNRRRPRLASPDDLDFALAQAFRRSCDECGGNQLHWFSGQDAVSVLGAEQVSELTGWLSAKEAQTAHWWTCLTCGNCGVFGGMEFFE